MTEKYQSFELSDCQVGTTGKFSMVMTASSDIKESRLSRWPCISMKLMHNTHSYTVFGSTLHCGGRAYEGTLIFFFSVKQFQGRSRLKFSHKTKWDIYSQGSQLRAIITVWFLLQLNTPQQPWCARSHVWRCHGDNACFLSPLPLLSEDQRMTESNHRFVYKWWKSMMILRFGNYFSKNPAICHLTSADDTLKRVLFLKTSRPSEEGPWVW